MRRTEGSPTTRTPSTGASRRSRSSVEKKRRGLAPPAHADRRGAPEQPVVELPVADRADQSAAMGTAAMPGVLAQGRRRPIDGVGGGAGRQGDDGGRGGE